MIQKTLAESAKALRVVAIILLIILCGGVVIAGLGLDLGSAVQVRHRSSLGTGVLADGVGAVAALLFAVALIQLIRLLGRIADGELFAAGVTSAFRSFAFWLMLSAIVAIAGPAVAATAAAIGEGGHHPIAIAIDLRDILFLLAGLVMFLVARMLDEAARLDAELREIV